MKKKRATTVLREMLFEDMKRKHPELPVNYIPDGPVKCNSANTLTTCIKKFLTLKGHQCERINTMGRRIDQRTTFVDVLGHNRTMGSVKWIPGTGTRGSADLSSTILGRSVKWEVKWNKDRQSSYQKEYQRQVEAAGGYYFLTHNLDEFMEQYEWLMSMLSNPGQTG